MARRAIHVGEGWPSYPEPPEPEPPVPPVPMSTPMTATITYSPPAAFYPAINFVVGSCTVTMSSGWDVGIGTLPIG